MKKLWNSTERSTLLCHFGSMCFGYLLLRILFGSLHLLLHQANLFHFQCLSTATYIFTKISKLAVCHRRSSIKECMFLEDGLGSKSSSESTKVDAKALEIDLCALAFVLSSTNCNWHPSLIQTWLGYVLNMFENKLHVTQLRIIKLKESLWTSWSKHADSLNGKKLFVQPQVKTVAFSVYQNQKSHSYTGPALGNVSHKVYIF